MQESILKDYLSKTPSADKWERISLYKRAGVAIPLFSVYSKNSIGMGDFGDLKLLIDWCSQTGNSILQLLPLNEVGPVFCPYDAISSYATEPLYICLEKIRGAKKTLAKKIEHLEKRFPAGKPHLDYRIKKEKMHLLWEIYLENQNCDFQEIYRFKEENAYWLLDFALFKALKEYHAGLPWYDWEEKYKKRQIEQIEIFKRQHEKEINFEIWLQWQLYEQLKEAKIYAHSKKVLLKGDLPVLVSRDSADVWSHPEFFKLEFAAGAPPDMYCAKGQRWGMPTYNWERISTDGYRYIKEKLRYAENFYDILRIDHVVGIFRIWSIPYNEPLENQGLNGFFDPKEENKWQEHGKTILSVMLSNTNMLLCAEDLGIIPRACPQTLGKLGMPGNEVQRWVKDWNISHDFLLPQDYRSLSVAMLSTHDTTNWPAWWENEAGTVDEALFIRKCSQHRIDYNAVKDKLFSLEFWRHGRLRWQDNIISVYILADILGKRKEEIMDLVDIYENTYQEKDKLWKHLKIPGPMREKSDSEIVRAVLKITLESQAIFCIQLVTDWLYLSDNIFKGDPYQYRINYPGTISENNWSLTIPISLEDLLKHKVNKDIRKMITASGRI